MHMVQRARALVRRLLLAPEDHDDAACGIELDYHVGPFIRDPDVVLFVDSYGVCVGPCVEIVSNLANVCAVRAKLQKLRGARAVGWTRGVAPCEYKDVPF